MFLLGINSEESVLFAFGVCIRVGTSIVQPVNSSGKYRHGKYSKKSLQRQIQAFMNKTVLKNMQN